MIRFLLLFGVLLSLGCATTPGQKGDAEKRKSTKAYFKGLEAEDLKPDEKSRKLCKKGLKKAKEDGWKAMIVSANHCLKAENRSALKYLAKSLSKRFPVSPWGSYYQSLVSELEGNLELSEWYIDLAVKKSGQTVGLFDYQRARLQYQKGNLVESVELFERALSKDKTLKSAKLLLGEIYYQQRDYKKSAKFFNESFTAFDASPQRYLAFSYALVQTKQVERCIEVISQGIRRNPLHLNLRLYLAKVYETVKNDYKNALSEYEEAHDLVKSGRIKTKPNLDLAKKIQFLEKKIEADAAKAKKIRISQRGY